MKIGILTFHRSHNYGAVLQVYALKTYLSEFGHVVKIIDYWPEYRIGMYDMPKLSFLEKKNGLLKKIKTLIRFTLIYPEKIIRYNRFQRFIEKEFNVTRTSFFKKGNEMPDDLDLHIYGSDQIWRYNKFEGINGFDPVYWGKFPRNSRVRKITYAASMGKMDVSEEQIKFIKGHINNFIAISVREESLKNIIDPLTDKNISHVLDPVFLLDSNQWMSISSHDIIKPKQNYILLYHLLYSDEAVELAKSMAKKLNCRIIEINGGVKPLKNPIRYKQTMGPKEFIALVANASMVISTSFHGVAFSLIFKKQFFALGMGNNAARVTDLLENLEISERYIDQLDAVDTQNINEINYQTVSPLLEQEKMKSIKYLEKQTIP